MSRIATKNICPPIPIRQFDWVAFVEGDEEDNALHAHGATELEAVRNLAELLLEELESEGCAHICGVDPIVGPEAE